MTHAIRSEVFAAHKTRASALAAEIAHEAEFEAATTKEDKITALQKMSAARSAANRFDCETRLNREMRQKVAEYRA